jgi:tripartite-type tricarboxylate transporter receptor subunit TctC
MTLAIRRRGALAALAALAAGPAAAQAWPARPVTLVVPFPPGGIVDQIARPLAQQLQAALGQPFVVENRPGAGGNLGADAVAKAAPDGHTLLLGSTGTLCVNEFLFDRLPFDIRADFAPVTLLVGTPMVLVVHAARPWQDLAALRAAARAAPGRLASGSAGNGSALHLTLALFNAEAQTDIAHVAYRGAAPAMTDLISGTLDMMFDSVPHALPHIRGGRVRALAVATERRLAVLPEVPTFAEAGLPGFTVSPWFGLAAPARTPQPVVARLHAATAEALALPAVGGRLAELGAEILGAGPDAFAAFLEAERRRWGPLIRAGNIRAE